MLSTISAALIQFMGLVISVFVFDKDSLGLGL
jgi:hypothetical protein